MELSENFPMFYNVYILILSQFFHVYPNKPKRARSEIGPVSAVGQFSIWVRFVTCNLAEFSQQLKSFCFLCRRGMRNRRYVNGASSRTLFKNALNSSSGMGRA